MTRIEKAREDQAAIMTAICRLHDAGTIDRETAADLHQKAGSVFNALGDCETAIQNFHNNTADLFREVGE